MAEFEGIFVVTLSPFRDGRVDERAVRHMVDHFVDAGVHGLVVLGSNGENPYLTEEEKRRLIDVSLDQTRGRVPVIVGTGCTGTDSTIALTSYAREAGADAALVALPQYFRVGFEDVRRHFTRLVQEVGLPVLYYNFPAVTRLELTPAEIAELAAMDGIVGVKETIFDVGEIAELAKLTEDMPFTVLSGTTLNLLALVPVLVDRKQGDHDKQRQYDRQRQPAVMCRESQPGPAADLAVRIDGAVLLLSSHDFTYM